MTKDEQMADRGLVREYERLRGEYAAANEAYGYGEKGEGRLRAARTALDDLILPALELLAEVAACETPVSNTLVNGARRLRLPADLWARIQAAVKP